MEATIRFLANDLLEGRGTPGHALDIAALYLATQLRSYGCEPGPTAPFDVSLTN